MEEAGSQKLEVRRKNQILNLHQPVEIFLLASGF